MKTAIGDDRVGDVLFIGCLGYANVLLKKSFTVDPQSFIIVIEQGKLKIYSCVMREGLYNNEEARTKEICDSDRYSLSNLDLLNLRLTFSSDGRNLEKRRTRPERDQRHPGSGDDYCRHFQQDRSQKTRPEDHWHKECQRERVNVLPQKGSSWNNTNSTIPQRHPQRNTGPICTFKDRGDSDDKNLLLLYSNSNNFRNRQPNTPPTSPQKIEEEFLRRPRYGVPKNHRIDVYDVSAMSKRPISRNRRDLTNCADGGGGFPFKLTPSGNFKVDSQQVVFESEKLSVLVADPQHTKVNIKPENSDKLAGHMAANEGSAVDAIMSQAGITSLGSIIAGNIPIRNAKELPEYEAKETNEILDPELNLGRLGYRADESVNWDRVTLPEKKNLYLELYARITNYTNADCKVYIDNEEFNCHLIVLQCYSELFDAYVAVKKVELASDKCSPEAFAFIYEWMITGEPSYRELTRDNVLDIFNSAKYLKIQDLIEQCWAFIDNIDVFNEDTAYLLYMDAKDKELPEVRELMLPRIQHFFLMLVSSQDWLELDVDDVKDFLTSNYIRVNCEMEVFMSAVRWLKYDWATRDPHKFDLLSCVRFGNIAPWQLVDIKRNPDNPEFMELAKNPVICKMIDDGLAFVIIKYWYGQENDDFQHWNKMLGLQEPPPRNWSGTEKAYFTYREFLIYLDQYRRNQMIEKTKTPVDRNIAGDSRTCTKSSLEKVPPRIPTMDEFLLKKKASTVVSRSDASARFPKIFQRKMSKNAAATIIQASYRGYLVRRMLLEHAPEFYYKFRRLSDHVRNRWQEQQRLQSGKRMITDSVYLRKKSLQTEKVEERAFGGDAFGGRKKAQNVMMMFTPSKNNVARNHMNEMSVSALGPVQKEYLTETSLFLPDRESVVVFGGIDPHHNYGVGRNTGKDICRYLPDYNVWEYVGDLPEPRHHHSVAFLKGRVYLAGGADPRDDDIRGRSLVVDTVWSFDPVKRSWFSEGSLNTPRKNFGLVVTCQSMFAIGGQDRQGRTLGSVEQFNPILGSWEHKAPLKHPRTGLACVKYRDCIWAAGGLSGSKSQPLSDMVESYNIKNNQWTEITRLTFPRCFSRMFVMSDRLYLIGGAGKETEKEKTTASLSTIEVWDVASIEWRSLTEMAIPRHGHAVAYLGTQILIIGGVTTIYMRALRNAECFCSQRGTWIRGIACLPTPLSGHAAVTLPPAMLMTN